MAAKMAHEGPYSPRLTTLKSPFQPPPRHPLPPSGAAIFSHPKMAGFSGNLWGSSGNLWGKSPGDRIKPESFQLLTR
jgi:hypothetical protein